MKRLTIILLLFLYSCNTDNNPTNSGIVSDGDVLIVTKVKDTIPYNYELLITDSSKRLISNNGILACRPYKGRMILVDFGYFYFSGIRVCDIQSGTCTNISIGTYYPVYLDLSPDAKKLLFTTDEKNLLVMTDIDNVNMRELSTSIRGTENLPKFSPDGTKIAYVEKVSGSSIWIVDTSGNNKNWVIDISEPTSDATLSWSPDGKMLAFCNKNSSNIYNICSVNIDGSGYKNLTNNSLHEFYPEFSPDGQYIAFCESNDIYIIKSDGSSRTRITNTQSVSESRPTWSSDSKKLLYLTGTGGWNCQHVYDLTSGKEVFTDSSFTAQWYRK